MVYWLVKYVFLGPIIRLMGRPVVTGLENIPKEGPVLLVSNHLAVMDSFIQCLYVPRRICFLAKSDYFTGTGLKGRFKRWFFTSVGQVPIDRTNRDAAQAAVDTALKVLDDGQVLGIYPEGTRSPDGRIYKGKTGAARIIAEKNVPVIPMAMIDTEKFNPPGTVLPRFHKVKMIVGKPIDLTPFANSKGDEFLIRSITDKIIETLMEMSGQQYVDEYAADVKKKLQNKES